MKNFKRVIIIIMSFIINFILIDGTSNSINANTRVSPGQPAKVAIISFKTEASYLSLVRKNLERIQSENSDKVEFTFFDSKDDERVQNEIIDNLLQSQTDLFVINLVNTSKNSIVAVIDKIKEKNVPVILLNIAPSEIDSVKSYSKAVVISTNEEQSGTLQGQIIVKAWNSNKEIIDKNKDNILEYVMLTGYPNNYATIARTKYSILAINDAGIKTQEIALRVANFDRELARNTMDSLFLSQGDRIEAVIANNDDMAIGAIESLQKYGYNKGNKSMTIPVVGIGATPQAQELIKKGFMTGTVAENPVIQAEVTYKIGMNLIYNKPPTDGTEYKVDETGIKINIPYKEYIFD